jgi:hypothetical protein
MSAGQGHETSFAQVVSEWRGVEPERVRLISGDTNRVRAGGGSSSARSMRLGSWAVAKAADAIVEKGRRIAGAMLEAAEADIEFAHGRFFVKGTDRSVGLFEVAAAAFGDGIPAELRGRLTGISDETMPIASYAYTWPSDREAVQNGHSRARAPPDQQGMGDVRNFAIDRVLGEDRVEISIEGVRGITHLRSAPSGARMLGLDQVLDPLSDLNLPLSFATSSKGVPSRASTRARRSASTSGQMPNHASNDGCAW